MYYYIIKVDCQVKVFFLKIKSMDLTENMS